MTTPTLTVTGPHPFQGHAPGESFPMPDGLEEQRQVEGALSIGAVTYDTPPEPGKMTCPACAERLKRPPKMDTPAELAEHYDDRHPGLVVPDWTEDAT